jgi:type II secretory pathway pseudopilin PulG
MSRSLRKGFTLIELIVVLLTSVFSMSSAPCLSRS